MFGIIKMKPEEKAKRDIEVKIKRLEKLLEKETTLRKESLARSEQYSLELNDLVNSIK